LRERRYRLRCGNFAFVKRESEQPDVTMGPYGARAGHRPLVMTQTFDVELTFPEEPECLAEKARWRRINLIVPGNAGDRKAPKMAAFWHPYSVCIHQ